MKFTRLMVSEVEKSTLRASRYLARDDPSDPCDLART